jgi:hypothetical protein
LSWSLRDVSGQGDPVCGGEEGRDVGGDRGDFEEYWRFHLAREHERLYSGAAQGEYTLGA